MGIEITLKSWWRGRCVGEDTQGNSYYQERRPAAGHPAKRWVVYNGIEEASKVPARWFRWLHYTSDVVPTDLTPSHAWMKPHQLNLTGTTFSYKPKGWGKGKNPQTKPYQAWVPPVSSKK